MKQIIKCSIFFSLILIFTACSTKDSLPKPRSSKSSVEKDTLYFLEKSHNNIEVNNKYGIRLKDLYPVSYDTSYYKPNDCIGFCFNLVKTSSCNVDGPYRKTVLASENTSTMIFMNTIGLVSLYPIITLGAFWNHGYFDWDDYYKDTESLLNNSKINRNVLLSEYSDIKSLKNRHGQKTQDMIKAINNSLEDILEQYQKNYNNYPAIHYTYVDKSGFYNNELLSEKVRISKNRLSRDMYSHKTEDYQKYLDQMFPCIPMKECEEKFSTMKKMLKTKFQNEIINMGKDEVQQKLELEKDLAQKSSKDNVIFREGNITQDLNESANLYGKASIKYQIQTSKSIDAKSKDLHVKYIIYSADFKNVYPNFSMKNKDIEFHFNTDVKNKTITILNKTNKFIEIDSISMYFNNEVTTIGSNQVKNFSTEISPQSSNSFCLDDIVRSDDIYNIYRNMTTKKAKQIHIKFGFAIKYSIGNSSKNKTLYKTNRYSLLKLIKNR